MHPRYKENAKAIQNTLFIIVIIAMWCKVTNIRLFKDNTPLFLYVIMALAISTWSYSIYTKIRYRQGKAGYLLIPTRNDLYYRISSFVMSTFFLLSGIIGKIMSADITYPIMGICLLSGVLLLINGIIDVPNGRVELLDDQLTLSNTDKPIDLKQVNAITIYPNAIVAENRHYEKVQVSNFNIDRKWSEALVSYLHSRTTTVTALDIRNTVS